MKKVLTRWPGRLLGLVMSIAMSVALLAPAVSFAKVNRTLDGGGGIDPNGGEGDPLDSNDHSGSGGDGDVVHSDNADPGDSIRPLIFTLADGRSLLLIPEFHYGTLSFRVIIVPSFTLGPEE
jgi:hypothetical protein